MSGRAIGLQDILYLSLTTQPFHIVVLQIPCYPPPKHHLAPRSGEYSQKEVSGLLRFVSSVQVAVYSGAALSVLSTTAWEGRGASEIQKRSGAVHIKDPISRISLAQGLSHVFEDAYGLRGGVGEDLEVREDRRGRSDGENVQNLVIESASAEMRRLESRGWGWDMDVGCHSADARMLSSLSQVTP